MADYKNVDESRRRIIGNMAKILKEIELEDRIGYVEKRLSEKPPEYIAVLDYLMQRKNSDMSSKEDLVKEFSPDYPEPIVTALENIITDFPNHIEIEMNVVHGVPVGEMYVSWTDRQMRSFIFQKGIYDKVQGKQDGIVVMQTSEVLPSILGDEEYVDGVWDANLHDR